MIINPLPPNFMLPITANRTASPGRLGREGASGMLPNKVSGLSPSSCGCQHGAHLYTVCESVPFLSWLVTVEVSGS